MRRGAALLHLDVEAVLAIHREVLAAHDGGKGLRDPALLSWAVASPQATFGGEAVMRDAVEVAAAYVFYLCRDRPFVDGNKRTALAACLTFLVVNGRLGEEALPGGVDDWERLVVDVAASRVDRSETTRRLRRLLRAAGGSPGSA